MASNEKADKYEISLNCTGVSNQWLDGFHNSSPVSARNARVISENTTQLL